MDLAACAGIGLKPPHFGEVLASRALGLWCEVHPENYFVDGGPRLAGLEAVRARHPLSLHGVAMSLAGAEPPDEPHLQRFAQLVRRIQPALVSEHLAWSFGQGRYFPDLLPFVRTGEALRRIAGHIDRVQEVLGLRIALENPAHYLQLPGHAWDEIDFLAELGRRSGCGLLLDVNNVFVSARNLGQSAGDYIDRFPADAVMEIHIAGHTPDPNLGDALLIDSHDVPVASGVWALYERLVERIGPRPTLLERDDKLPPFDELMAERGLAQALLQRQQPPQPTTGQHTATGEAA